MITKGTNESGAQFSKCERYRYVLWRRWENDGQFVMFVGLNPSTADENVSDPTVTRCINFAKDWGFGGIFMMNAYGYRATDPKDMKAQTDPNGPGNDLSLSYWANYASQIIVAWGVNCEESREGEVLTLLDSPVYCLGTTKAGRPRHPLYIRRDTQPILWIP